MILKFRAKWQFALTPEEIGESCAFILLILPSLALKKTIFNVVFDKDIESIVICECAPCFGATVCRASFDIQVLEQKAVVEQSSRLARVQLLKYLKYDWSE